MPGFEVGNAGIVDGVPWRVGLGKKKVGDKVLYSDRGWAPAGRGLDPWMIARTLRIDDVDDVRRTLRGLYDRHLALPVGYDTQQRYQRWTRPPS